MDPEIQRALDAGYTPQQVAAELQRRGLPVPPALLAAPGGSFQPPAAAAADATSTASPDLSQGPMDPTVAGLGVAGVAGAVGARAGVRRMLPAQIAQGRVGRAVEQSGGVDALLRQLTNYEQAGRGNLVTLGDLSPALGQQGTDFVATNSEPARTSLLDIHSERQRGVPQRLLGDVQQLSPAGYQSPEYLTQLSKQSQADFAAGPTGYQGLRDANPAIDPKYNKRLTTFLTSDKLKRAWTDAASVGAIGPLPPAGPTSFETLQNLKERLDGLTTTAFNKGDGDLGRRLAAARDDLVGLLTDAVPNYREVASTYAGFSRHQDAVQAGVEAWSNHAIQLPDLARQLQDMSPEQREAFRRGIIGGYIRDIENAKTNRNLANELMTRSATTEKKLELIFGSEKAFSEAVKRYGLEASMAKMGGYVGGSATARRLTARGTDVGEAAVDVAAHPTRGILDRLLGKVTDWHAGHVARQMEPWFTTQGASDLRGLLSRLPK